MAEPDPVNGERAAAAVFLSYATQDASHAAHLAQALRAAGVEVWLDQSELRGGDAWDQRIRQQIRSCRLFVPIISRHTQDRPEGYFRLEWKLAVDRSHLMASEMPFLVPVVVDATTDAEALVPDRFREVQWTRVAADADYSAFAARVRALLAAHVAPRAAASNSFVPAPGARRSRAPRLLLSSLGLGLVLSIAALGWLHWRDRREATPAPPPSAASLAAPVEARSIAVLPFVDMSEKHDQEYFSDGISEELIGLLAKVDGLRVPARTSSFYFKGRPEPITAIGRELRVANVLEGSVRRAGRTVRVTAQLIRAQDGFHVWSESYDRDARDILKVQDDIAAAVVTALKVHLGPAAISTVRRSAVPEAYDQYLLGKEYLNRRTEEGFRLAIEAFRGATRADPGFSAAYAGLAMAEDYDADRVGDAAGFTRAVQAAETAIRLAPDEADGYLARGTIRNTLLWDWSGAYADFAQALKLDPGSSLAHMRFSDLLSGLGRIPESLAEARRARELDPLSGTAWEVNALDLLVAGDLRQAEAAAARARELNPRSPYALYYLGLARLLDRRAAEALTDFAQSEHSAFRLAGTAMAEHALGHATASDRALAEAIDRFSPQAAYQIAEVHAWRGQREETFAWLERAWRQRDGGISWLKVDPLLASVRGDPRFQALQRRLKLPD